MARKIVKSWIENRFKRSLVTYGSMKKKKRRKKREVNITGLCDFHFSDEKEPTFTPPRRYWYQRNAYQTKEQFLLGTYQFVLKHSVSQRKFKKEQIEDPDLTVPWKDVEFVHFRLCGASFCPICLDSITNAVITSCGHLFCLQCIYTYFFYSHGKPVLPCPLCKMHIEKKAVKICQLRNQLDCKEGVTVSFELVTRKRNQINVFCRNSSEYQLSYENRGDNFPFESEPDADLHKYTISTPEVYLEILEGYLQTHDSVYGGGRNRNSEKKNKDSNWASEVYDEIGEEMREKIEKYEKLVVEFKKKNIEKDFKTEKLENPQMFYQSVEAGSSMQLHHLTWKMLEAEYGTENLPPTIKGMIFEVESVLLTENYRNSHKSQFGHLPLMNIRVCELDVKKHISRSVLSQFRRAIEQRRWVRESKREEEEREDMIRLEKVEEERLQRVAENNKRKELYKNYERNFPAEKKKIVEKKKSNKLKKKKKSPPKAQRKAKLKGAWKRKDKHVTKLEKLFGPEPKKRPTGKKKPVVKKNKVPENSAWAKKIKM